MRSAIDKDDIRRRVESGESYRSVARSCGVSLSFIAATVRGDYEQYHGKPRPAPASFAALMARADISDGHGDWRERANCAGTDADVFFPEAGGSLQPALRICAACPVTQECLDFALENDERYGVWGGVGADERRRKLRPKSRFRANDRLPPSTVAEIRQRLACGESQVAVARTYKISAATVSRIARGVHAEGDGAAS